MGLSVGDIYCIVEWIVNLKGCAVFYEVFLVFVMLYGPHIPLLVRSE